MTAAGGVRPQTERWRRYWRFVHWVNPAIRSPFDRFTDWVVERARGKRWLDAGCGRHSLPEWRSDDLTTLLGSGTALFGCDLDRDALKVRMDDAVCTSTLAALPFRSESFSVVSSNMVFEHMANPSDSVAELVRVTQRGGRIIVHTVNRRYYTAILARLTPHWFHEWIVWLVERRKAEDVYPTLYRANTEGKLRDLFARHGARVVRGGLIDGIPKHIPLPVVFWLAIIVGLVEMALAKLPVLSPLLRPNLLMEFERT